MFLFLVPPVWLFLYLLMLKLYIVLVSIVLVFIITTEHNIHVNSYNYIHMIFALDVILIFASTLLRIVPPVWLFLYLLMLKLYIVRVCIVLIFIIRMEQNRTYILLNNCSYFCKHWFCTVSVGIALYYALINQFGLFLFMLALLFGYSKLLFPVLLLH